MRFRLVKTVQFHTLRPGIDRRGPIVTLTVKDIPNTQHAVNECADIVRHVIAMLSTDYAISLDGSRFGEQNECWLNWDFSDGVASITVQHKYWSEGQVDLFCAILRLLAERYGWEVRG